MERAAELLSSPGPPLCSFGESQRLKHAHLLYRGPVRDPKGPVIFQDLIFWLSYEQL